MERRGGLGREGVEALVALLAADSPAAHVRVVLAHHRKHGTPFDAAWSSALRSIPRKDADLSDWREQLRWARAAFRAAYERDTPERQNAA